MRKRPQPMLVRTGAAAVLVLALAGCTPGGQFDPTSMFANDMFDTKTKLKGDRQPVFPNGVPGTTSGVPPEMVKGYQPPPEPTAEEAAAAAAEAEKNKPKPKPKPKVARAPAQPATPPRRINIGPGQAVPAAPDAPAAPQGAAPPPAASPQQQSQQSPWPAPPSQQGAVQSRWPDPPKTGTQ
jgi:hypothetical protein